MPKIRILQGVAGLDFSWAPGTELEVSDAEAETWADGVRAELVPDPVDESRTRRRAKTAATKKAAAAQPVTEQQADAQLEAPAAELEDTPAEEENEVHEQPAPAPAEQPAEQTAPAQRADLEHAGAEKAAQRARGGGRDRRGEVRG